LEVQSHFAYLQLPIDGQQFEKNDRLVFVVCGSASSWIAENLLGSTGFVGAGRPDSITG
jgi:hypothetical protein